MDKYLFTYDQVIAPAIRAMYGASLHGDLVNDEGIRETDIEFPTMRHASNFVDTMINGRFHVEILTRPVKTFDKPVTIMVADMPPRDIG